jgi:hypothetical protein
METTPSAAVTLNDSDPAALRDVYLGRLERLLTLRQKHELELNRQGLRLLDRAIFAAFCACRDAGIEEPARAVLRDAEVTLQRPVGELGLEIERSEARPWLPWNAQPET